MHNAFETSNAEYKSWGELLWNQRFAIDPVTSKAILDDPYLAIPEPVRPAATASANVIKSYREEKKDIRCDNERLDKVMTNWKRAWEDRISVSLNNNLTALGVVDFQLYMAKTYGVIQLQPQEVGNAFNSFIKNSAMNVTDRFSSFIQDFDREAEKVKLPEDCRLGMLLALESEGYQQRLPSRLLHSIKWCKANKFDYAKSKEYLIPEDDEMHTKGIKSENNKKAVKRMKRHDEDAGVCNECNQGIKVELQSKFIECLLESCHACLKKHYSKQQHQNIGQGGQEQRRPKSGPDSDHYRGKDSITRGRGFNGPGGRGDQQHHGKSDDNVRGRGRGDNNYQRGRGGRGRGRVHFEGGGGRGNGHKANQVVSSPQDWQVNEGDDDDDDDDDYEDWEDHKLSSDQRPITKKVARYMPQHGRAFVLKKSSVSRQPSSSVFSAVIDSGCDTVVVAARDEHLVDQVIQIYSKFNKPDISLRNASNDSIHIKSAVRVNDVIDKAYVSPHLDQTLVGTQPLREKGYLHLQLPTSMDPSHASYLIKVDETDPSRGEIHAISDANGVIDLNDFAKNPIPIRLPNLLDIVQAADQTRNANAVYGLKEATIKEKVEFIQNSFMCTQSALLAAVKYNSVLNLDITEKQVRKYSQRTACWLQGHQRKRNVDIHQFAHPEVRAANPVKSKAHNPLKMIEYRNLKVGAQVGVDVFGPHKGYCAVVFTDKASGNHFTYFFKYAGSKETLLSKETKKGLSGGLQIMHCVREMWKLFKRFGHTLLSLRSDSHNIFRDKRVKSMCVDELKIKPDYSPPGMKEFNGLAENGIQFLQNQVTSMMCLVAYCPPQFWRHAWTHACLVDSIISLSNIPDSTISKYEEFYRVKPNLHELAICPFGVPISYWFPVEQRSGKFPQHSSQGIYLACETDIPGGIRVFNPRTKGYASTSSYEIMEISAAPAEWLTLDPFMWDPDVQELSVVSPTPMSSSEGALDPPNDGDDVLVIAASSSPSLTVPPVMPMSTDAVNPVVVSDHVTHSDASRVQLPAESSAVPSAVVPEVVTTTTAEPSAPVTASEGASPVSVPVVPIAAGGGSDDSRSARGRSHAGNWKQGPARLRQVGLLNGDLVSRDVDREARLRELAKKRSNYKRQRRRLVRRMAKRDRVDVIITEDEVWANVEERNRMGEVIKVSRVRVKYVQDVKKQQYVMKVKRYAQRKKTRKQHNWDNPTVKQAMKRSDWSEFQKAMEEELKQLVDEGVYTSTEYQA